MAQLEIRNLHVALEDGTEIVKGVDLAVDPNQIEAERHVGAAFVVPRIGPEGDLLVRPAGDEPPAKVNRTVEDEGTDVVVALEPLRQRRHRVAGVRAQQGHDGIDVPLLPGTDVELRRPSDVGVAGGIGSR